MKMKKMARCFAALLLLVMVLANTMLCFAAGNKKYGFTKDGVRYEIGMDAAAAFQTLGKEIDSRDVNTCANGYVNKAYTYGANGKDFEVYVEQDKAQGKDIVASITLLSANVATEEGLRVGDSAETVTKIYPAAVKGLGSYKLVDGNEEIYIKMKGNEVSYISYLVAEQA